jgi:hypothetical protein
METPNTLRALRPALLCALAFSLAAAQAAPAERWSAERANAWYARQPWLVGCNLVPAYARNMTDFWQDASFNPSEIARELALAESIGFNCVRVFLPDVVWRHEPDAFKNNIRRFLDIAQKHHIRVILTFFTNGGAAKPKPLEARMGKQDHHYYQSPGTKVVNADPSTWGWLENYVKDILTTFKDDPRVLFWCLYNEPQNPNGGADSDKLLRAVFKWAREINPSQPLTAPIWGIPAKTSDWRIIGFLTENCDIMTMHDYKSPADITAFIKVLKRLGRPVICTEFMNRPRTTLENSLPIFKKENVGALCWGLVARPGYKGYHSGQKPEEAAAGYWYHNLFNSKHEPYESSEITFLKKITGKE